MSFHFAEASRTVLLNFEFKHIHPDRWIIGTRILAAAGHDDPAERFGIYGETAALFAETNLRSANLSDFHRDVAARAVKTNFLSNRNDAVFG